MKVADLFIGLQVESADFKTAVSKAATEAGTAGGQTLSKTLGAGLKAGALVIGAGLAFAFKGAVELEGITAKFRAETGATAEEAKRAGQAIAEMSRGNLQGMAEIGEALTKVHTDLGLTGEEAVKTTESFLKFATATGQEAATAVTDFDDILDGYGLTADKIPGIMDQLVKSHQLYGGSIEANTDALGKMAPQLTALGLGLDDGIGLLNLFAESGLDAEAAQKALNSAVLKMPPGTSFEDIVNELLAIEDPAQRAARSVEIFGSKAGVGLANAIRPGMTSMEDLIVTADESVGSMGDAAAAIEGTFGNKIQLLLKNFGGALAGLGQEFGPVLTGLASLGTLAPALISGLSGLWGKIASSSVVKEAAGAAGAAASAAYAVGMKVVDALMAPLSAAWVKLGLPGSAVMTSAGTAGASAGGAFLAGVGSVLSGAALLAVFAAPIAVVVDLYANDGKGADAVSDWVVRTFAPLEPVRQQVADLFAPVGDIGAQINLFLFGPPGSEKEALKRGLEWGGAAAEGVTTGMEQYGPPAPEVIFGPPAPYAEVGEQLGETTANSWTRGQQRRLLADRAATSAAYAETIRAAMIEAHRIAAWGGAQTPGEFSQGLRSAFDTVRSAFSDLKELMKNTLSPAAKEAELIGVATSKRLAKALDDGRPEVRGEAQQIALDTIAELHALNPASTKIGDLTTLLLARALPNERPALQTAINQIVSTVTTPLGTLPGIAETAGERIGGALAQGLRNKFGSVTTAAENLAGIIRGRLELGSPAKAGPWSKDGGPFAWMLNAGKGMAENLQKGINSGGLVMPPALAGMAGFGSFPGIHTQGMGAPGRSVTVGDITVNVYGVDGDPEEIGSKAAAAFAWNLEHAMSAVNSG